MLFSVVIGCSSGEDYDPPEEEGKCPNSYWDDNWEYSEFVSFFDDSLAIYKTIKYNNGYYKEYFLFEGEKCVPYAGDRHIGLWLANYRTKQKPIFIDSLEYDVDIIPGILKDSSLLVMKDKKFGFWKIKENSKAGLDSNVFKDMKLPESTFISYNRANSWIDGNVLLMDNMYEQKLVLNPQTGNSEVLDTTGQYEWLNLERNDPLSSCRDISFVNDKIICIRFNYTDIHWELVVDGLVSDTKKLEYGLLVDYGTMSYRSFPEKYKWLSECYNIIYTNDELTCSFQNSSDEDIVISYDSSEDKVTLWKELFHALADFDRGNYAIMDGTLFKIDSENFKFDDSFKSELVVNTTRYSVDDFN